MAEIIAKKNNHPRIPERNMPQFNMEHVISELNQSGELDQLNSPERVWWSNDIPFVVTEIAESPESTEPGRWLMKGHYRIPKSELIDLNPKFDKPKYAAAALGCVFTGYGEYSAAGWTANIRSKAAQTGLESYATSNLVYFDNENYYIEAKIVNHSPLGIHRDSIPDELDLLTITYRHHSCRLNAKELEQIKGSIHPDAKVLTPSIDLSGDPFHFIDPLLQDQSGLVIPISYYKPYKLGVQRDLEDIMNISHSKRDQLARLLGLGHESITPLELQTRIKSLGLKPDPFIVGGINELTIPDGCVGFVSGDQVPVLSMGPLDDGSYTPIDLHISALLLKPTKQCNSSTDVRLELLQNRKQVIKEAFIQIYRMEN